MDLEEVCTIVPEDVAIPSGYLHLPLWAKDIALSLEQFLFTVPCKSIDCFTALFFKFGEPLSLCCDVGRMLD